MEKVRDKGPDGKETGVSSRNSDGENTDGVPKRDSGRRHGKGWSLRRSSATSRTSPGRTHVVPQGPESSLTYMVRTEVRTRTLPPPGNRIPTHDSRFPEIGRGRGEKGRTRGSIGREENKGSRRFDDLKVPVTHYGDEGTVDVHEREGTGTERERVRNVAPRVDVPVEDHTRHPEPRRPTPTTKPSQTQADSPRTPTSSSNPVGTTPRPDLYESGVRRGRGLPVKLYCM